MHAPTAAALLLAASGLLLAGGCRSDGQSSVTNGATAASAEQSTPGLRVGDRAPNATVLTRDGRRVSLADLYGDAPLVVTFYRGGWCPYCEQAMTE